MESEKKTSVQRQFSWRRSRDARFAGYPSYTYAADAFDQHAASWCGCCYLVAAVQVVEDRGHLFMSRGSKYALPRHVLSLQSVMDHFQVWNDDASGWNVCHGGSALRVLACMKGGACPLTGRTTTWHGFARTRRVSDAADAPFRVRHVRVVEGTEAAQRELFANGPLLLEMSAQTAKAIDGRGVVTDPTPRPVNHAVSVVGWERVDGVLHWVVRNSWGKERAPKTLPTDYIDCVAVDRNRCQNHWEAWRGMPNDPGFFLVRADHPSLGRLLAVDVASR